jgi:aminoglycoside/choline kinase family phosphotransferase
LRDFGSITLLQNPIIKNYKLAIDELIKIQNLKYKNLPVYDKEVLLREMNLCKEWFNKDFYYNDIFEFILQNVFNT